jgi:hypothetical protein
MFCRRLSAGGVKGVVDEHDAPLTAKSICVMLEVAEVLLGDMYPTCNFWWEETSVQITSGRMSPSEPIDLTVRRHVDAPGQVFHPSWKTADSDCRLEH